MKTALIIVDVQNDFCPGGSLAVAHGDKIIEGINFLTESKLIGSTPLDFIIATQDWHPDDHKSFAVNHPGRNPFEMTELQGLPQVLWPKHCVQNTKGAEFHPHLVTKFDHITQKGTDPLIDSYSGFFDNGKRKATDLDAYLKSNNITEVYVCGLATDYCVAATAIDAAELGYKVHVITSLCKGVDITPGDSQKKINEMIARGIDCAVLHQVDLSL